MGFDKKFFLRSPLLVARDLIGATLTTECKAGLSSGIIVETEAYGAEDPASHSFKGMTKRNKVMFEHGAHCYVYLIYGINYCVNVVTEEKNIGSAVLIRALQPLGGIELMQKRRGLVNVKQLTSGPGKLCMALGIDAKLNGEHLMRSAKIYLTSGKKIPNSKIGSSPRIGISKATELHWRVFLKGSEFISRHPR